ncbi:MAG: hypothetical protein PUF50_04215 [Erysipelotrichaceae bacterium]|nr:hypothetical protein [Erysipelotrichaceae bacterium]
MEEKVQILQCQNQMIRIYDRLLIVVGNHGVGKTNFLHSIIDGTYRLKDEYQVVSLLLTESTSLIRNLLIQLFQEESQWDEKYSLYIQNHFSQNNATQILSRIATAHDLLEANSRNLLSLKRWILIRMLLDVSEVQHRMIVIDEPELAAHPLIVREICALLNQLKEKGNIIVVATNSEEVVSRLFVDIEQVIRLEKGKKIIQANAEVLVKEIQSFYYQDPYLLRRFSSSNQLDIGLNNVVSQYIRIYLSSVLCKEIFMIMHADRMILGEGSSEDVLFDYIDQVIHPEWMRENKVHYMGCLGKSTMPFYFLFFNHLGIQTVCLFDADNDMNLVHVAYANAFQNYENEHKSLFTRMVLDPDLEHVLQIVPDYKLLAMEKPINIYQYTFATNAIKEKVCELANLMKLMFDGMEKEK